MSKEMKNCTTSHSTFKQNKMMLRNADNTSRNYIHTVKHQSLKQFNTNEIANSPKKTGSEL